MQTPEIYYLQRKTSKKNELLLIIDLKNRLIRIVRLKQKFVSENKKAHKRHLKKNYIDNEKYKLVNRKYMQNKLIKNDIRGILPAVQLSLFNNNKIVFKE